VLRAELDLVRFRLRLRLRLRVRIRVRVRVSLTSCLDSSDSSDSSAFISPAPSSLFFASARAFCSFLATLSCSACAIAAASSTWRALPSSTASVHFCCARSELK